MNSNYTLEAAQIDALVGGYHAEPFAVLGKHAYFDGTVVRTFQPGASEVQVVDQNTGRAIPMQRRHPVGYFELVLDAVEPVPFQYELRVTYGDSVVQSRDPYSFPSTLGPLDIYLLAEGTDERMYDKAGAHVMTIDGVAGTRFLVWAPSALRVSVVGDFNVWDGRRHVMRHHPGSGWWELFIPGVGQGDVYKYEIKTRYMNYTVLKADPVAFYSEVRPKNASIVWDLSGYEWQDDAWMEERRSADWLQQPMNVYEVHLGSWRRKVGDQWLTYTELADELIPYVQSMGFTHIELLPIAEHPYDGSWGYQVTGYFAATSRFGTPQEFMAFVDRCHQAGIGVILDWVPAHFPMDEHGLGFFDGTHLYEHADPRKGQHPDWGTYIFNFGRNEVREFLIANALFWLDKYHIDGLRVDAVASMLYLDFSREPGQWVPNIHGGRENLEALAFIRAFNEKVHALYPGALTIAEESTSWPGVTHPVADGGLGFDLKWNMGWMHDTLQYFSNDPIYRAYHHGTLTFSMLYAFSERFMLPFSHDEVVHLKKSMLDKMPGDTWRRFANLRALFAYQLTHPGKKLNFMGNEFGQWREWSEARSLDWHLLEGDRSPHAQLQSLMRALNHLYQERPSLHENDQDWQGFDWLEVHDSAHSILSYVRRARSRDEETIVICNFTPVVRDYRIGVPQAGRYREILSTDDVQFGGSGVLNEKALVTDDAPWRGQPYSIRLRLPPLGVTLLELESGDTVADEAAEGA